MSFLEAKKFFEKGLKYYLEKDLINSIIFFEKSLKIVPNRPSTLKNLVAAYIKIDNLKKAEYYLKNLILYNDSESDLIPLINKVYRKTDKVFEFKEFIENNINKDIDPILKLQKDLYVPKIFKDKKEIIETRNIFEKKLDLYLNENTILKCKLEKEQIDPPIFPLSYDEFDNKNNFKKVVKLLRKVYPELNYKREKIKKKFHKIRLGIVSQFLNNHTIGKLFKGIVFKLDSSKFEIKIFHTNQIKKENISDLIESEKKLNIKNFFLPNNFKNGAKLIEENDLDIIFYPDIGMSTELYYYTYLKLAETQITSWGHPETTGNESIDYFLSSKLLETKDAQSNYSEKLLLLNNLPMYYYKPKLESTLNDNELISENIYSCPQTLIKIHPDFDKIFEKILNADKKAKIYLIKDREKFLYKKIIDRFKKNISADLDRIIFLENMSLNQYVNHCGKASVLLDPFYFGAGNSFHESMFYGTPTVTKPSKYLKSRIVLGAYKQMKIDNPPVVKNDEEYINKAVEIANNKKKALEIKKYYRDAASKYLFENKEFIKELEEVFIKIKKN